MNLARVAIPAAAAAVAAVAGLAARDRPRPAAPVIRTVRVHPGTVRALSVRRLVRSLPGAPVSVVSARDQRVWVFLRTRTGGRIGELAGRHGVRLLPPHLPRPVELLDGLQPAPYLGFAATDVVGAVNPLGIATLVRPARGVTGIAFDRFGQLWYAAGRRGTVGRVDPVRGIVREWSTGLPGSRLGDIAPGPHGVLVVRDERGRLGLLAGRGDVRWSAVRPSGSAMRRPRAGDLAGDPSDGMWATWAPRTAVRLRFGRELTVIRLPSSFGTAGTLVAGPDGGVWVAAERGGGLARIAPGGHVTLFRMPGLRGSVVADLTRRPGELLVAARRPAAVYEVALPGLRPKLR